MESKHEDDVWEGPCMWEVEASVPIGLGGSLEGLDSLKTAPLCPAPTPRQPPLSAGGFTVQLCKLNKVVKVDLIGRRQDSQ